jgi:predicted metal-dependent enzyme (double-stranded beta helix superfamily)
MMFAEVRKMLSALCTGWADRLGTLTSEDQRIAYMKEVLPGLLTDRQLMAGILAEISRGGGFNSRNTPQLFDNELLLFVDPRRRFSLRMYLHTPGEYTAIHDHSAWGVLGNATGTMEIIKYQRLDDGKTQGKARLKEAKRVRCLPGQTDRTLPLDAGIHQVGNPTSRTIAIVNVYGTPVRRLYINRFDILNNRVHRVYPPRIRKKRLAAEALKAMQAGKD